MILLFPISGNYALYRPVSMTNTYSYYHAYFVTDGSRIPSTSYFGCCHSGTNTYGALWVSVDLGMDRDIKYITITNRDSCTYDFVLQGASKTEPLQFCPILKNNIERQYGFLYVICTPPLGWVVSREDFAFTSLSVRLAEL